ncbi:ATPase [Clostridioides difficile]|uniref:sensor histidine kinase n=1 Tax=Clostridioides difficile TaxID=1496 RepID=UPI0008731BFF|nr:HAMP domain-containing sensor histidine kinase [Clostridioides difficile]OFA27515.1 ATPase [Clostridioides difficile]
MNTVERFFRRYISSTIGIVVLFVAVNLLLAGAYLVIFYFNNTTAAHFPTEDFSNHVINDGTFSADQQAQEILHGANAWAMILDDNGTVVWENGLPEDLPKRYTATDIAMFSRWYLEDYPINIWKRDDGLLVIGLPPGDVVNYYFSFNSRYVRPMMICIAAAFIVNIFLMIFLFVRNTYRVEKAMGPILKGIRNLSSGKTFHLEEVGELAEINAGLNKAGDYLMKKDNTRAVWIRGVSHDIRTPLSMILGYASEIEDTTGIPEHTQKQAGIIRRQSEKLKDLVADLNLTTKLEYSMQPIQKQNLNPVELARQVVSEFLNEGLSDQYEIEFSEEQPGKTACLNGDSSLLQRMLSNLIHNSIVHNPNGCKISLTLGINDEACSFSISDNGKGISEPLLNSLNHNEDISSTQEQSDGIDHGLGLKVVKQIVKAHQGKIHYFDTAPHGLSIRIELPLK